MSCAIEPFSRAHQWRKAFCAIIEKRLRQKRWRRPRAIAPFSDGAPMAQAAAALRWRSACLAAPFQKAVVADYCSLGPPQTAPTVSPLLPSSVGTALARLWPRFCSMQPEYTVDGAKLGRLNQPAARNPSEPVG
jgi:hypothetical protein